MTPEYPPEHHDLIAARRAAISLCEIMTRGPGDYTTECHWLTDGTWSPDAAGALIGYLMGAFGRLAQRHPDDARQVLAEARDLIDHIERQGDAPCPV